MAKIISTNSTIYIPTFTGNYTKEISVLVFYPGIPVGGKDGKVYMPPLVLGAVPDWEKKYVIVIPNKHTSDWPSVKKEYTSELTKVGLTEKDLSVGCFSGAGNGGSSIQQNLSKLKVLNLMLMDPTSTGVIVSNVKTLKSKGTNCYLMYNPNNWGKYTDIKNGFATLASAVGKNSENTNSKTYDHEKIPGKFLTKWRDVIEKTLTSPGLTSKQSNEVNKSSDPTINKEATNQTVTETTNVTYNDDPVVVSSPKSDKFDAEVVGIDITKDVVVNAKQEMPEFTIYIGGQSQFSETFLQDLDPEYSESEYSGPEEETIILPGGEVIIAFNNTELTRDDGSNETGGEGGEGVQTGGSLIVQPGGNVSNKSISLPSDLADVQNSSTIKTKLDKDIVSPGNGQKVTSSELYTNMNQFVSDVLGPFATFLKKNYPDLYKKWYITSATRNYVPKGGSLTSQHMKGQAIDSQIPSSKASNPGDNIKLLNAILTWYQNNPVGYGQILFETRGNSCWIHWSYKRGSNRLQLLRFKNDGTLRSAAVNTVGSYVKPGVTAAALGF
jgi:hypothetical protein